MEPLQVDLVYFYPKENAQAHHTVKFEAVNEPEVTTTIVRRGQPFNGVVRFNRPYEAGTDIVQFLFTLGDGRHFDTKALVTLRENAATDVHVWSANITCVMEGDLTFEISTPVTLPSGNWALRVISRLNGADRQYNQVYDFPQDLYILFNPWIPDDQTYMEDSDLLEEYVLNDVGKIFQGKKGTPWIYGQFDGVVLPACMFMLDRANVPFHLRGNPVNLVRAISRIVNAQNDSGVVSGRWDGKYQDGTDPSYWAGSVDILQEFLETQDTVRYGQCWVFGGVVTTVCRALGIPARTVSNLVSAHDANKSLTVDKYYSSKMEELKYDPVNPNGADSIWNYHVWNDVWMARPDLPAGFGGWQAIDATPQETSSGYYQCGPASLEAIKQGVLGLGFDVEFLLASVNADLMRWREDHDSDVGFSMVSSNTYHIGRNILTKKPYIFDPNGDEDCEDVTHLYKHREGTSSERIALMNGVRASERAKRFYSLANANEDLTFKLRDLDTVLIGEPFNIALDITNNSNEVRNVQLVLSATSVFYNGVRADLVNKQEKKVMVQPGEATHMAIEVTPGEYLPKLVEYSNMKISCMAYVQETKQSWADDDDFVILKPKISIKFDDYVVMGQPTIAKLSFNNPLDVPLTNCEFRLNSTGMNGKSVRLPVDDVPPMAPIECELPVEPSKLGNVHFVATFKSTELKELTGASTVVVDE